MVEIDRPSRGERRRQRGGRLRFRGVETGARFQLAHDRGEAGKEPPAAQWRHDRVDIRKVFENLEARRRVARDEPIVVERVDEMAGHAGGPVRFHGVPALVVGRADDRRAEPLDGAGGKSVLPTMWPLLAPLSGSLVVSLDEVARGMKLVAERARVIAEGAAGCAIAAALSGRAGAGKIVAVVSGGNIDLAKFAALVGACPP